MNTVVVRYICALENTVIVTLATQIIIQTGHKLECNNTLVHRTESTPTAMFIIIVLGFSILVIVYNSIEYYVYICYLY